MSDDLETIYWMRREIVAQRDRIEQLEEALQDIIKSCSVAHLACGAVNQIARAALNPSNPEK